MWIEDAFLQSRKLLIKVEFGYRMTMSLAYNCKSLREDLNFQQFLIKEIHIQTNEILISRYQNYN